MKPIVVRTRRIAAADSELVENTVVCPERGTAVRLSECAYCGRARGVVEDAKTGRMVLDCEVSPPSSTSQDTPNLKGVTVGDLLTSDVVCTTPDAPVHRARRLLREANIGAVPVVDSQRVPVGIVAASDLLRNAGRKMVSELMTAPVITVPESMPMLRAAAMMAFEGIHHLPVVDDTGQLIGLLSSLDVLRHLGEVGDFVVPRKTRRQREGCEDG